MIKKSAVLLAMVCLFGGIHVFAAVGDPIHPLYATDIKTFVDGKPIKGYAMNGKC